MAISGGAIADASAIKIDYAHGLKKGSQIIGGTKTQIKGAWRLDGINMAFNDELVQVEIPLASIAVKGATDFLADKFGKITLTGDLLKVSGKNLFTVTKMAV